MKIFDLYIMLFMDNFRIKIFDLYILFNLALINQLNYTNKNVILT